MLALKCAIVAPLVLFDAGAFVIGAEWRRRPSRSCAALYENHVQAAAVDADFRILVAGQLAARLLVDELAEAVVETALAVLDAGLEQFDRRGRAR